MTKKERLIIEKKVARAWQELNDYNIMYGGNDDITVNQRTKWNELDNLWRLLFPDEEYRDESTIYREQGYIGVSKKFTSRADYELENGEELCGYYWNGEAYIQDGKVYKPLSNRKEVYGFEVSNE